MNAALRKLMLATASLALFAGGCWAQTSSLEGDVKGEDGTPLRGALVKIDRKDIKGAYKVKTDKKGHYFHAGLPLGTYKITLEVDGKDVDSMDNVRTRLGDPTPINFDLSGRKQKQEALAKAAETGQLTAEQSREMSSEQKAQLEKAMKERSAQMAKNKALNDAFNGGMEAMKTRNWDGAIENFTKASEMDTKQHVIWAQLADAYMQSSASKPAADQPAMIQKGLDAYAKALELKPDDAAYHNNFGLALTKAKKFQEAQEELNKAAALDPPNAGRYYYNLGAVLVNTGNIEPAGAAFKKALESDPNYADAHYQYGIYLIGKAQVDAATGKINPPPGTKEAFMKYLELKPDGPNADSAKSMLQSIDASISTEYKNPSAPPPTKKATTKKK